MIGVRSGIDEYGQPAEEIISGYVGEFKYFGFSEVPPHCLACDGSEVSRETYNELFTVFGETFGAGDGATTFNLPDLRGAFLRCIGGNAAELGTAQADAMRNITGTMNFASWATGLAIVTTDGGLFTSVTDVSGDSIQPNSTHARHQLITFNTSNVVPTANENRPINYAANICVVYE